VKKGEATAITTTTTTTSGRVSLNSLLFPTLKREEEEEGGKCGLFWKSVASPFFFLYKEVYLFLHAVALGIITKTTAANI
jgi:hypothetical protein